MLTALSYLHDVFITERGYKKVVEVPRASITPVRYTAMCVLRHGCSLLSLLCWLPFAAIMGAFIYFGAGSIAIYVEMFGDISLTQNTTVAVERVTSIARTVYETREMPHAFMLWGGLAVGVYILAVAIYCLVTLGCIARDCSNSFAACAPSSRAAAKEEQDNDEEAVEMVDEYARYNKGTARL